jgi:hypothetical protein
MKRWIVLTCLLAACGSEGEPEAVCREDAATGFGENSGWNDASYCDAPTDLGCYPFHESSADTCGPFISMRTSATAQTGADACATLLTSLNCGTYAADDGATTLTFNIASADRFTMRVTGTYRAADVDTTFFFNPCHQACQAAITLDTLDADQQKICEIPRQGKPVCLFPEGAHSMTFVRADGGSVVIRSAGVETALARVVDAE